MKKEDIIQNRKEFKSHVKEEYLNMLESDFSGVQKMLLITHHIFDNEFLGLVSMDVATAIDHGRMSHIKKLTDEISKLTKNNPNGDVLLALVFALTKHLVPLYDELAQTIDGEA